MCDEKFTPVIRFAVMSDIHIKDEHTVERERMEKGIIDAYKIAESHSEYKKLDALVVNGDFANSGTETQFLAVKDIIDRNKKDETKLIISVASHEYNTKNGAMEAAWEKLKRHFNSDTENHDIIKGFHFISISPSRSCNFDDDKIAWTYKNLKIARDDDPKKPIFMFQHPHMTGTVLGSILWGEDELFPAYVNFPQIIDFSGHSHAPINDPRSIHQEHFTCVGSGTLSYFEHDEFDKVCGRFPANNDKVAQMLIVEADENNRVRIYPYDILTGNFFPYVWKIDVPSDPDTFLYTDEKRINQALKPYFPENSIIEIKNITENSAEVEFTQAVEDDQPYVCAYDILLKDENGNIMASKSIWSDYYFYDMPEKCGIRFDELESGKKYSIKVIAKGFFKNSSSNSLTAEFITK